MDPRSNYLYKTNKRARLDITVSDHQLPLSQSSNSVNEFDNWGDDNDDEILLQASQACEQAISADVSVLPEYSRWAPPEASTQRAAPAASRQFTFKVPSGNPPSAISTHLRNKCSTISSPLPGIASKLTPDVNGFTDLTDDLVINAKAEQGHTDYVRNQIFKLEQEKKKLLVDIDELQQKCVTKEGEASILRTQLKACQMAVDSARMEKARATEEVQKEFKMKLDALNSQLADLKTHLEIKDLEIISVKEKCKNLESGKRMTQVIVPSHDISSSYKHTVSSVAPYDNSAVRPRQITSGAQTEDNSPFVKLKKTFRRDVSQMFDMEPFLLEPKFQVSSRDRSRSSLSSRLASAGQMVEKDRTTMTIVDYLVSLAQSGQLQDSEQHFDHLLSTLRMELSEVRSELARGAASWDCDDRNFEAVADLDDILPLLDRRELYSRERGVSARRLAAAALAAPVRAAGLLPLVADAAGAIAAAEAAPLYTGLLLSLCALVAGAADAGGAGSAEGAGRAARALAAAGAPARPLLRVLARAGLPAALCPGAGAESCQLQTLLKQVEGCVSSMARPEHIRAALSVLADLTSLHEARLENRCECQAMLVQVLVYSLRVCTDILFVIENNKCSSRHVLRCWQPALGPCAAALRSLYRAPHLAHAAAATAAAGHLAHAAHALRRRARDPALENLLDDLTSMFQAENTEAPASYHTQAWLDSFQECAITD